MPFSPVRRASLAALVALAAAALTGCAASTVTGHGSALAGAPSTQDFPSSGAASSAAPSVTDSLPVPSSSVPTSASAPATPGGSGVLVTDAAGHFQVRMPGTPERSTEPGSFGGYKFTVHLATVKSPYIALVEGEDVTPALPLDQIDVTLRSAVSSFQSSSGMTLISQKATTFNGHTARSAVLEHAGDRYQLVVAAYSGSQIYLLFAPQGAKFDALASSFRAI